MDENTYGMGREFEGKKILLGIPNHFGLPERFKENLTHLGFDVTLLPNQIKTNIGLKNTLIHAYRKFVLKDRTFKAKKKVEKSEEFYQNFLHSISPRFDYTLIIRPDLFSETVIREANLKTDLSVAYQWDGIDRFPLVKNYLDLFDRFLIFDVRDLGKYQQCLATTNFYFDDIKAEANPKNKSVFFVGTFMADRIHQLNRLAKFFNEKNYESNIFLQIKPSNNSFVYPTIHRLKEGLDFKENLILLQNSNVVLDFKNEVHYGLSFRTFEAVGFEKKLITNNPLVKQFDFYNPSNIFVLESDTLEGLDDFLQKPYVKIDDEVRQKYSFTSWIKKVLNQAPNKNYHNNLPTNDIV